MLARPKPPKAAAAQAATPASVKTRPIGPTARRKPAADAPYKATRPAGRLRWRPVAARTAQTPGLAPTAVTRLVEPRAGGRVSALQEPRAAASAVAAQALGHAFHVPARAVVLPQASLRPDDGAQPASAAVADVVPDRARAVLALAAVPAPALGPVVTAIYRRRLTANGPSPTRVPLVAVRLPAVPTRFVAVRRVVRAVVVPLLERQGRLTRLQSLAGPTSAFLNRRNAPTLREQRTIMAKGLPLTPTPSALRAETGQLPVLAKPSAGRSY